MWSPQGLGWALYSRQVSKRQKREGRPHEDKRVHKSWSPDTRRGRGVPNILTFAAGFQNCGRTGHSVSSITFLVTCHAWGIQGSRSGEEAARHVWMTSNSLA